MKPIFSGKVREIYDISDKHLIIVTTDRISAFDRILPVTIKNKGVVLNRLSNFWFKKTKNISKNHIVDDNINNMPEFFHNDYFKERTVMVTKLDMLPYEFVVRGYIFGNMWKAYEKGEIFCGNRITGDYKQAQKLKAPVITPALKHNTDHDEYVDMKFIKSKLGDELTKHITEICFDLYDECSKYALLKGIIIADAKFEFGLDQQGHLVLADEIFTPDSSRFWNLSDYKVGDSPKSFDKQLLRDWLTKNKTQNGFPFDKIPQGILFQTEKIYNECLNKLMN